MGKLATAKKVIQTVGKTTVNTVDKAVEKDSNNLLLLILIVIVWLYLFFSNSNNSLTSSSGKEYSGSGGKF